MRTARLSQLAGTAFLLFSVCRADADVTLNAMFSDHMVLQRDRPIPVWGTAEANEQVIVKFGDETKTVSTNADGKWMVVLQPLPASADAKSMSVSGQNQLTVQDILVGDVYLGMGQSNMDWTTSGTDQVEQVKAAPPSAFANIRTFIVAQAMQDKPADQLSGKWNIASPDNLQYFSAVLTYFGRELRGQVPDVPIGLVRASVGATNLYCWLPNELRDKDPSNDFLRGWWQRSTQLWTAEAQAKRDAEAVEYEQKLAQLKADKLPVPADLKRPGELMGPKWSRRPSALYNGMIAPLQPFPIRSMVWYQGEWDAKYEWTKVYHDSFVAFAKSLRETWSNKSGQSALGEFSIYIIQLPAREPRDGQYWAFLREVQQRLSADVPNTVTITTYDTNDPSELHPRTKTVVGQRLAYAVVAKEYDKDIAWRGPHFKSATPVDGGMKIGFESGAGSIKSSDGMPLRLFELAGDDGKYHEAVADIHDGVVFVKSSEVADPKTVRYAFVPAPIKPNLVNAAGLPAEPFRTDMLPLPEKVQ